MITIVPLLLVAALVCLLVAAALGIAGAVATAARPAAVPAVAGGSGTLAAPPAHGWLERAPTLALIFAFVLLVAALGMRALAAGHAPWSNLHEFSLAFAAALVGAYLLLLRDFPIAGLAIGIALLAAAIVGFALGLDSGVDPLVPALQQPVLLTIHVGAAVLAYAVAGVAFVAAAAELVQRGMGDAIRALPTASTSRVVGHRAVLIAFPILTIAIALGSVWANVAWRSYWSNDPKELAAAATWLVFGAYLHVANRRDGLERLAPWLIVIGFVGVLFTFIGAGLFIVGEHSYGTS